jgi:hypothetical protein
MSDNDCTLATYGKISRPLLYRLTWSLGPFAEELPQYGWYKRVSPFRRNGTYYVFSLKHLDMYLWGVSHFHGCRFAMALLCVPRLHARACVFVFVFFMFATYE